MVSWRDSAEEEEEEPSGPSSFSNCKRSSMRSLVACLYLSSIPPVASISESTCSINEEIPFSMVFFPGSTCGATWRSWMIYWNPWDVWTREKRKRRRKEKKVAGQATSRPKAAPNGPAQRFETAYHLLSLEEEEEEAVVSGEKEHQNNGAITVRERVDSQEEEKKQFERDAPSGCTFLGTTREPCEQTCMASLSAGSSYVNYSLPCSLLPARSFTSGEDETVPSTNDVVIVSQIDGTLCFIVFASCHTNIV